MEQLAMIINKDGYICKSQIDVGYAFVIVIDGEPQHYELQDGDKIIYDDVQTANELLTKYERVKWYKNKWIGEEPLPMPESPEPQDDPLELLMYRVSLLEVEAGRTEYAEELISSGRLNPAKQIELEGLVHDAEIRIKDEHNRKLS